jgi:hypothetical protein
MEMQQWVPFVCYATWFCQQYKPADSCHENATMGSGSLSKNKASDIAVTIQMYLHLHVKWSILLSNFNDIRIFLPDLHEVPKIKFHESLSSGGRADTCEKFHGSLSSGGRTDTCE